MAGIAFVLTLLGVFFWVVAPTLVAFQFRQSDHWQRRKLVLFDRVVALLILICAFVALARLALLRGMP